MKNSLKSLFSNKQGLALAEFALFLPLILVMFFGVVEFTRYVIITQKAERSAYALSNIMSQFTPIQFQAVATEASANTLDSQVFTQFARTMDVYNTPDDRIAIISSITKTSDNNSNSSVKINWQRTGGGSLVSDEVFSFLNGVKATEINSANDADGSTAGTSPSFPGYNGQLMHNALSDMFTGENMIITETFYSYQPFLGSVMGGFGASSMPKTIMKSVTFSRPRNGDIDTLKRPTTNTNPDKDPDPEKSDTCATIKLQPAYRSCSSKTEKTATSCTVTTTCKTCPEKQICKRCTTVFNGNPDCEVYLDTYQNCTYPVTKRACSTGTGTTTPPTTGTGAPPPS